MYRRGVSTHDTLLATTYGRVRCTPVSIGQSGDMSSTAAVSNLSPGPIGPASGRASGLASGPLTPAIDVRVNDAVGDAIALRVRAQQVSRGAARAAVLGVNDGLVSNLCLILGVAGAGTSQGAVRLAGFASLIAGACSMAAGEWVSVRSQVELFQGVLAELRRLIARNPKLILDELVSKLVDAGFDESTAKRASVELPLNEDRFMHFTARTVFGIDPEELGSPVTAALSSLLLFSGGALVPLFPWFFMRGTPAVLLSAALTAVASLIVGGVIAKSSGNNLARSALRQLFIVIAASAITYGIGKLFGTAIG
jgi:vacuolar iron transporter family protein